MPDHGLGRLPEFDDRSKSFGIRTLLGAPRPPRSFTWSCKAHLDQGSEGACVGFSFAHELAARPVQIPATDALAFQIYREAQKIDQWPGEAYSGTSILAGAKIVQARGYFTEYRWGFNLADVLEAVSYHGPAVIGINWYSGMSQPDMTHGFLSVTGRIQGGHAILIRGVSVRRQAVLLHNSWGRDWGINGTAQLRFADLERLLNEDGECCIPVKRAKGH